MRAFPRRQRHRAADSRNAHPFAGAAGRLAVIALAVLGVAACDENDLTGVGRELVSGGVVRTVEVILDAQTFLLSDTTLGGYSKPSAAATRLITLDPAAGLRSRAAIKFAQAPFSVLVPIDSMTTEEDTLAVFVGARVQLVIDSLSRAPGDSATLLLEAIQESWDPSTATWENRVDSTFVQTPWSAPGGGAAVPVASAVWSAGMDTVSILVDSAIANAWSDGNDPTRGLLVRTDTDGARLEIVSAILFLQARPTIGPDTILEVGVGTTGQTSLIDAPPAPDLLLVGGVPAYRSFLRFAPGIDTLPVECPEEGVPCDIRLADADLTFAGLELTPVDAPGMPTILRAPTLSARSLLPDPQFPLERAPLGASGGSTEVAADTLGGVADSVVVLDVTRFLDAFVQGGETVSDRVAVVSLAEGFRFGTVAFGRGGTAEGPRLRLVLTVASPQEIR